MYERSVALPVNPPTPTFARRAYLATHPAAAASIREFARLTEEVVGLVKSAELAGSANGPKVRREPHRTIIQAGPVALTLTWLRDRTDSAAAGQLLVAAWRGSITPGGDRQYERPNERAVRAEVVWEQVYVPEALDEAGWCWRGQDIDACPITSGDVALRCAQVLADEDALLRELQCCGEVRPRGEERNPCDLR